MWPLIPKDCNCSEEASNEGVVCDKPHFTGDFYFDGISSICNDLQNGDDITVAIQKLQNFLCSVELTEYFLTYIQNNLESFQDFIILINNQINCQTITNCYTTTTSTSSTTTTTTTIAPTTTTSTSSSTSSTTTTTTTIAAVCTEYTLQSLIINGSWTALSCENVLVGGVASYIGEELVTGCILDTSLVVNNMEVITDIPCTTTTTSSTSTSTTTSTSSTTTTTTTMCPCVDLDIVIGATDVASSIVDIEYVNCAGTPIIRENEVAGLFRVCAQSNTIPLIYRQDFAPIIDSSITVTSNCCP
jgi:hypothetical protein